MSLHTQSSLGQITDIRDHKRKYDALTILHPEISKVVLYGASRGGATTFSALAENQYKNVALCIIEGAPSSMSSVIKSYVSLVPGLSRFGAYFYNHLPVQLILGHQHKQDKASQARGHVERFPINVPLLVISSLKDGVVPVISTIRLALRVAAHRIASNNSSAQPVYFLQLSDAGHNTYTELGTRDSQRYNRLIHAVYKMYNLPHDARLALEGEYELEKANLMTGANRTLIQEQIKFWSDKPNRAQIRNQAFQKVVRFKSDKEVDDNQLAVYEQMPLFRKCIEHSLYFFQRAPHTDKQFKALKEAQPSSLQPF